MKNDEEKPLGFDEVDVNHLFELLHHNSDWVWEVDAQGRYIAKRHYFDNN
ncbi:hypothetical protein [Symbiopectobacterium sp. RP]